MRYQFNGSNGPDEVTIEDPDGLVHGYTSADDDLHDEVRLDEEDEDEEEEDEDDEVDEYDDDPEEDGDDQDEDE